MTSSSRCKLILPSSSRRLKCEKGKDGGRKELELFVTFHFSLARVIHCFPSPIQLKSNSSAFSSSLANGAFITYGILMLCAQQKGREGQKRERRAFDEIPPPQPWTWNTLIPRNHADVSCRRRSLAQLNLKMRLSSRVAQAAFV
jgi:hypothetical protein